MATIYSIGPSASMEEASGSYISPPPKPQKTSLSETGSTALDVANLNQRTVYEIGTQPTFPFIAVTKYTASIAMGCNTTDIKTTDSGEDTGESIVDDTDDTSGGDDTGESLVDEDGDRYASIESGGDDCDDTDASVNPGATEVTENGVDDDCDTETADEAAVAYSAWNDDYTASDVATTVIVGDATGDTFGQSIASISKTNPEDGTDDGYGDMVIGAPMVSGGGAVYVVYGPTASGTASGVAGAVITGKASTDKLGYALATSSQDLDSAYLLISSGASSTTDGYVAIAKVRDLEDGTISDVSTTIIAGSKSAGYQLGADSVWADLSSSSDENEAIVTQFGSTSTKIYGALVFTDAISATSYADADAAIVGASSSDGTGNSSAAGDLDGDGIDDIIVGSELATAGGYSKAGLVNVQGGDGASGTISISSVDLIVNGPESGAQLGGYVYAADIDGDGLEDVIAGAPSQDDGDNDGCLYIFISSGVLTGSLAATDADNYICGYDTPGSSYDIQDVGQAFSAVDLDLDGSVDLVYSANSASSSGYKDGRVYIQYGPSTDWPASAVVTEAEASQASFIGVSGDYIGSIIDTEGDRDGNVYNDMFIAATNYSSYTGKIIDIPGVTEE